MQWCVLKKGLIYVYFQVHNWTVEQTSEWLATNVELPQYIPNFIQHRVTGATLPRLVVIFYLVNQLFLNAFVFVFVLKTNQIRERRNTHSPTWQPCSYCPSVCLPPLPAVVTCILLRVLSLLLHSWFVIGFDRVGIWSVGRRGVWAAYVNPYHLSLFFFWSSHS